MTNFAENNSEVRSSEYFESSMGYDGLAGYMDYYSAGSNIYWDFINHDNVDIRVLAMTGDQVSDVMMGERPVQYYSLLKEDNQGYGYFTVPSSGQWGITFYHHDSSAGHTVVYCNVGSFPRVIITKPSSTEKWVQKETLSTIKWTNYGVADAKIELWKGSNYISEICPYILRDGYHPSYDWYVPNSLDEDNDYRIKIINLLNPNIYDYSDYFEVYENDQINIIEPKSSSIFGTGTNQEIIWTWQGLLSSLDIELWNGTMFKDHITSFSTECDGFYTWELPYNISEGNNYRIKIINHDNPILNNFSDFFTIYDNSPPLIIIKEPDNYTITSQYPPDINIDILDLNLDQVWYQLQNDTFFTDIYSWEGQIEQSVWDQIGNGTLQFNIYANDTNGNTEFGNLIFYKDIISPAIIINEPTSSKLYGILAPQISIEINDPNLDQVWYSLNNGINISYVVQNQIDQAEWDKCNNGPVLMKIFANDTIGNNDFIEIIIWKDAYEPIIVIYSPFLDQKFKTTSPTFNISVLEETTTDNWYTIFENPNEYHFTNLGGSIDQIAWNEIPEGLVDLTFYARDEAGNVGSTSISIIKEIPKNPVILGYELIMVIGIIGIISIIKVKKKRNLIIIDEEITL